MKLSIAIADLNADEKAFVVWRGFEESFRKASDLGYDGAELALRSRDEIDVFNLRRLLDKTGLQVSGISTGQVFSALDLYLTNPLDERRNQAVKVLSDLIELAGEFGGVVNLGRSRGFYSPEQTKEQAETLFLESLAVLSEKADKHSVTIIVEPVNRYELNFLNNLDECAAIVERSGLDNVAMMADVFHMNIEDARMGEAIERNSRLVKYVHLADSNRHAPGDGHLDFDEIFTSLKRISYDGWLSVEALPFPSPDETAKRSVDFIRPLMEKYGFKKG